MSRSLAVDTADILERVRAQAPRVHCITNAAAQVLTANLLLAAGAVPSLTVAPDEIADFVGGADALLVNLGTLDAARREAIAIAVDVAQDQRLPWALDPVFCDRSAARAEFALTLAGREPDVLRGNPAELEALAGEPPEPAVLERLALDRLAVVAMTGPIDLVTDGAKYARLANGHRLMARVTAVGCAGTALIAACLAVENDTFLAACAGLIALGVAGEVAALRARGPGSFVPALIDAIDALDAATLATRLKAQGPLEVVA